MNINRDSHLTDAAIEAIFPENPKPAISIEIVEAFQSHLTDAFETALYKGMEPIDALAIVLSWVASEMTRLKPG